MAAFTLPSTAHVVSAVGGVIQPPQRFTSPCRVVPAQAKAVVTGTGGPEPYTHELLFPIGADVRDGYKDPGAAPIPFTWLPSLVADFIDVDTPQMAATTHRFRVLLVSPCFLDEVTAYLRVFCDLVFRY